MSKLQSAVVKTFEVDPTPGNLNGLKTVIGVVLIAAAHSLNAINDVAAMLPGMEWVETVRVGLQLLTQYGETALEVLGSGFLSFGLLDKAAKFLKGIFG